MFFFSEEKTCGLLVCGFVGLPFMIEYLGTQKCTVFLTNTDPKHGCFGRGSSVHDNFECPC